MRFLQLCLWLLLPLSWFVTDNIKNMTVDFFKMGAIFQFRVRKLIGQTRGLYNLGLRVRGSPHPHDYGALLPPLAAESNAFRIQSDWVHAALRPVCYRRAVSRCASRILHSKVHRRSVAFLSQRADPKVRGALEGAHLNF